MKRFYTSMVAVAAIVIITSGCDKMPFANSKGNGSSAVNSEQMLTPIQGEVLAQVDNWRIGTEDFQARLELLKENPQYANADLESTENKKAILQELIRLVSLSQEARRRGYADDEQVKLAMADFERTLLVQKLVEDISKDVNVSDQEIKNFYDANSAKMASPATLRLREIAVASENEANAVLKRFLDGESFVTVAQQVSLLDTRAQGGDLGVVSPRQDAEGNVGIFRIVEGKPTEQIERFEAYWNAVFSMQVTDDARKVKGDDGNYYIVKVTEIKPSEAPELNDELKAEIKAALQFQQQTEAIDKLATEAKQKSNLILNEELL